MLTWIHVYICIHSYTHTGLSRQCANTDLVSKWLKPPRCWTCLPYVSLYIHTYIYCICLYRYMYVASRTCVCMSRTCVCMYVCMYSASRTCACMYVCMYACTRKWLKPLRCGLCLPYLSLYIHIYIYIYTERERERYYIHTNMHIYIHQYWFKTMSRTQLRSALLP